MQEGSYSPRRGRTPFVSVLSVLVSSLTLWPCPTVHCLSCLSLTISLSFSQYLPRLLSPSAILYCSWGPGALDPGPRAWKMESGATLLHASLLSLCPYCLSPFCHLLARVQVLSQRAPLPGPLQALRPGDGGKGCPYERWSTHGAALTPSIPRASLWSSCVVLPLLALTWMSAVLAVTDRRSALFQILFAVFDSLEGFVIVMVHCILRREVGALGRGSTVSPRGGLVPSM